MHNVALWQEEILQKPLEFCLLSHFCHVAVTSQLEVVKETRVLCENHCLTLSHWQTLYIPQLGFKNRSTVERQSVINNTALDHSAVRGGSTEGF